MARWKKRWSKMTIYDEINMLIDELSTAWGGVIIQCNGETCKVSGRILHVNFEAPTIVEALREAALYEAHLSQKKEEGVIPP
jgi:hypothetical protein